MSEPSTEGTSAASRQSEATKPAPKRRRGLIRRVFWMVLRCYCLLVVMLAFLQRSMIYFPSRAEAIRPEDARFPAGQVHSVTVRTDDHLDLGGWLILPEGHVATTQEECDKELKASEFVVIFFSGNGGNRTYRPLEFQVLTKLGASVVLVDYRGYGENPGKPSEDGLIRDARAVREYVTKQRNVPADRVILYGESLGGGVATRLAAEMCDGGEPPAGLVLRSTFSSLPDAAACHYPWVPVRLLLIDRFTSVDWIRHVTCPLLQVHGLRDTIVPIHLGRRLFDAAPATSASGIGKRFLELAEADHNDVIFVAERQLQQAIGDFFSALRRSGP